jgi:hypothetical protein
MAIPAMPTVQTPAGSVIYFMVYGKQGILDVWYTSDTYPILADAATNQAPPQPADAEPPPKLADLAKFCLPLDSGYESSGTHCWQYNEGPHVWDTSQFDCSATPPNPVQVNADKHCTATCRYWPTINLCKCSLKDACVDECREGVIFGGECVTKQDFDCPAPEYDCPSGPAGPVACATTKECKSECAASCGSGTACSEDCEQCCIEDTCNKNTYTQDEMESCLQTCRGMCNANKELCNAVMLLMLIGGAIDLVMLLIHGIHLMTAEDAGARKEARDGIIYVLLGSTAVLSAFAIVALMLGVGLPTCVLMYI